MQPVIQVELFHVRFDGGFDQLFQEMGERVHDMMEAVHVGDDPLSSGIKTTLRFYDENNLITKLIGKLDVMEKEWWTSIPTSTPHPLTHLFHQCKRFVQNQKKKALEKKLWVTARRLLKQNLKESEGVAGQQVDFTFRYIRGNEKHELWQSIQKSPKALWFAFEPNDLLSDTNEILTCYL